jgi:hypothetical protein
MHQDTQEGAHICLGLHSNAAAFVLALVSRPTFLHVLPAVLTPTSSNKITMAEHPALRIPIYQVCSSTS